jgi:hypothetical protein
MKTKTFYIVESDLGVSVFTSYKATREYILETWGEFKRRDLRRISGDIVKLDCISFDFSEKKPSPAQEEIQVSEEDKLFAALYIVSAPVSELEAARARFAAQYEDETRVTNCDPLVIEGICIVHDSYENQRITIGENDLFNDIVDLLDDGFDKLDGAVVGHIRITVELLGDESDGVK